MTEVLAHLPEGWAWLALAAGLAGLVRGFAGFGSAMIFLPIASQHLSPFVVLTVLSVMELIGPAFNVPRLLRDGHLRDVGRLGLGALVTVPIGLGILFLVPPEVFRWAVSIVALVLLGLLIAGWRYTGALPPRLVYGTGALGGFFTGAVGLPGPPVIMLYMASDRPVAVIRANLSLYLILADLLLLGVMGVTGVLVPGAILIGVALAGVYLLASVAGAAIFAPERAAVYRGVAYVIIAVSAVSGLPVWG